jgi:hypothetical protein
VGMPVLVCLSERDGELALTSGGGASITHSSSLSTAPTAVVEGQNRSAASIPEFTLSVTKVARWEALACSSSHLPPPRTTAAHTHGQSSCVCGSSRTNSSTATRITTTGRRL